MADRPIAATRWKDVRMLLLHHRQLGLKIFFVPSKKNGGLQSDRAGADVVVLVLAMAVVSGAEDGRTSTAWRTGGDAGGGVT